MSEIADPPPPIPIKILGEEKYWMEIASSMPDLAHWLHARMVCVLAFNDDLIFDRETTVGNGFVIAEGMNGDYALVITAKHVLEGAKRIQTPHARYASSSPFVPPSYLAPSIEQRKLKIAWSAGEKQALLRIVHATYNDATDHALCIVEPRESKVPTGESFEPKNVSLDLGVPAVGDQVLMASLVNTALVETVPPSDRTLLDQQAEFESAISLRLGVVTGVYLNGYNQYRWPCFTTSIPGRAGMSGCLVGRYVKGELFKVCGVLCADLDPCKPEEEDFTKCGTSLIGCTWSALQLRLPEKIQATHDKPNPTLLHLMKEGKWYRPPSGLDDFTLVEDGVSTSLHRRLRPSG